MHRRRALGLIGGIPLLGAAAACGDSQRTSAPRPEATTPPAATRERDTPAAPPPSPETPGTTRPSPTPVPRGEPILQEYAVVAGARPHDVAPRPGGGVWYTGQGNGTLGLLDPGTGRVEEVALGAGAAPHGVIVGPDGHAWITDGGLNAIVRVHDATREVSVFPLPPRHARANLNTAAFDRDGTLWFTGQAGVYGRCDPVTGRVESFDAPRGSGPYGICATPAGDIWYASLAGNHIARIDTATGVATPVDPPTPRQGARRVWSDSKGVLWVAEWNAGQVARYDPAAGTWKEWLLPGPGPQAYAAYVDESDTVWLTDFAANAIVAFEPRQERFTSFPLPRAGAAVRQLLGRPGEVWGAESGLDALVVVRL